MAKIKLNLDDLRIESFATEGTLPHDGTVAGYETADGSCVGCSVLATCPGNTCQGIDCTYGSPTGGCFTGGEHSLNCDTYGQCTNGLSCGCQQPD